MEGEVLKKLGLADTHVRVPEKRMGDYAWGYNAEGKTVRVMPGIVDAKADWLKTTARQMGLFLARMMEPGRIGDVKLRQSVAVSRGVCFPVGEMTQGLGWEMYD